MSRGFGNVQRRIAEVMAEYNASFEDSSRVTAQGDESQLGLVKSATVQIE